MSVHYYQSDNHSHPGRATRRLKWFMIGLLIGIPIIIPILFFTTSIFVKPEAEPIRSGVQTSVISPSTQVFRTPFFQIQAGKTWSAVANETTNTKFVYRQFKDTLIQAQLDIYVNTAADQTINATRLLPVTFSENGSKLNAKFVSEPCAKDAQKNRGYMNMAFLDVAFRCNTDATDYSVLVGREGGSTLLDMVRPDGTKATYVIHYRDLRAIFNAQDIEDIVNSFQTR